MKDAWQKYVRDAATLAVTVAGVALILQRLQLIAMPVGGLFLAVVALSMCSTAAWWAVVDQRLARFGRWRLRLAWAAYIVLMFSPAVLMLTGLGHAWDALPAVAITWVLLWHIMMAVLGSLMAVALVFRLARVVGRWASTRSPVPSALPDEAPPARTMTRRRVLVGAVLSAPLMVTGAGTIAGARQTGRFTVRRAKIALPRLPERLSGLTITHLSDIHVGRLFRPEHLPALVEAANRLRSDMVVITGDVVDHNIEFLEPALDAIAQLEAPHGRFSVVGNHDLIDDPMAFIQTFARHEEGFLYDRHVRIDVGGEPIQVAGLFWSRYPYRYNNDPGHDWRAGQALMGADPNVLTLGLAHHPHAFDTLADRGVDLTLSGHTHGGQIMLTPPGSAHPIGGGPLLFRYLWGEYARGSGRLHVTSGVGNWFPVRLNAPAEIVQLQLV